MAMIKARILEIQKNIVGVCQRSGRDPNEIILVGVTKTASLQETREAIAAGLKHIGENRVGDAQEKFAGLGQDGAKITKHMIGHLQSNKVKDALKIFDMIQSIDSIKLVKEIEKHAAKIDRTIDILIEVNSGEAQKSGVAKIEAMALVETIASECPHVNLLGLMTMAPFSDDKTVVRAAFRDLRLLRDEIAEKFKGQPRVEMKYLSMGMTDDYGIALEEGANMLRLGRAIFN
jgi:pyridoxal phosphate enzyme (YggS family)